MASKKAEKEKQRVIAMLSAKDVVILEGMVLSMLTSHGFLFKFYTEITAILERGYDELGVCLEYKMLILAQIFFLRERIEKHAKAVREKAKKDKALDGRSRNG